MDLLGGINGPQQNAVATQQLTAQSQQQAQQLATLLREQGQNKSNQKFTSPWQVAGQWAQAIAGKNKQNQINPNYYTLNGQQPYGTPGSPYTGPSGNVGYGNGVGPTGPIPPSQGNTPDNSALPWSGNNSDNTTPDLNQPYQTADATSMDMPDSINYDVGAG